MLIKYKEVTSYKLNNENSLPGKTHLQLIFIVISSCGHPRSSHYDLQEKFISISHKKHLCRHLMVIQFLFSILPYFSDMFWKQSLLYCFSNKYFVSS